MDTVLLVEDDTATREWLAQLLGDCGDLTVAKSCGTVGEALQWLAEETPAIVLTDIGLPDGSGLDVVRAAARRPGCEILVLSIFGDERNVLAAIDAGAGGYLLKDGSLESIKDHLACLKSGGSPLSPRIARTLVRRHQARPAATSTAAAATAAEDSALSEREFEVLTGVSKGFTYAEVASALGVTTNTVRTHIRHIYEKLAVNSGVEAVYEYNRRLARQGLPPLG